mgnify:FL=1
MTGLASPLTSRSAHPEQLRLSRAESPHHEVITPPLVPLLSWLPELSVSAALDRALPESAVLVNLRHAYQDLRGRIVTFNQSENVGRQDRRSYRSSPGDSFRECCSFPLLTAAEEQTFGKTLELHRIFSN